MTEHDHHHHHSDSHDLDALAEMVDLDAEVLHEYLGEVTGWVRERAGTRTGRILDLGCGTGTGTMALAERFAEAEFIAVDQAEPMLERVRAKAHERGIADRVRTVQADLDGAWPGFEPLDLVWASASLHHLAEPDRVLADIFATLRPGGLLVAAELASFPYFLPDDVGIGEPGLEERCHAALRKEIHDDVPLLGSDWGPRLTEAGFTVEEERRFVIELTAPLPPATGRYAQACLSRLRTGLGDRLDADDAATLDALLHGDGLLTRTDLSVRTNRTVWLAGKP